MKKSSFGISVLSLVIAIFIFACNTPPPSPGDVEAPPDSFEELKADESPTKDVVKHTPTEAAKAKVEAAGPHRYGLVTNSEGIDDGRFNQMAWDGLQQAAANLDIEVDFLESRQESDYVPTINKFLKKNYRGIVTVGYPLAAATKAAAESNPETLFAVVDYPSQTPEDMGLLFKVDEAAFLAGYLSAGMTKTGIVCTYGGLRIPPVIQYMVGFEQGVIYFNQQHNTQVKVLGWKTDRAAKGGGDGSFTGYLDDSDDSRHFVENFLAEGCDIIFPVTGKAGLATAALAQERNVMVIGVDFDQYQIIREYQDVFLTSTLKNVDVMVPEVIEMMETGIFKGGENVVGDLANNGVALAPFHTYEAAVPETLKEALIEVESLIIAGTLSTGWPVPDPPPAEIEDFGE